MRKIAALFFIAIILVSGCKKDENMLVGSWTVHQIEAITNRAGNSMIGGDTVAHSTYHYVVAYSADDSLYTQSLKRFYASDTAVELQSWDTAAYTLSSTLMIRSDGTFKMTNAYLFLYQRHESLDTSYTCRNIGRAQMSLKIPMCMMATNSCFLETAHCLIKVLR